MGWRCNKMLAVGWIDASKIGIGDMLEVQILLKSYNAKVVSDPMYDPENQLLLN
jgi:glycine cleavage system aminomethyltransferase T